MYAIFEKISGRVSSDSSKWLVLMGVAGGPGYYRPSEDTFMGRSTMPIHTPTIAARLGPPRRQKRLISGKESSGGKYGFDDTI